MDIIENHVHSEFLRLMEENESLKEWIRSSKNAPTCAVCGKIIPNVSTQRLSRPILWCSKECFLWKPRKIIALEREYGLDIVEVLKETTRKYGSIRSQCDALWVSVPYFCAIVNKYCGDYTKFMVTHSDGKRKEIYRKQISNRNKPTK